MADSMIAFAKGSKLPTVEKFRKLLKDLGVELAKENSGVINLADMGIAGCWPGTYKDEVIAFEFDCIKLDKEEIEEFSEDFENFKEILGDRDYRIDFTFRTEEDIFASMISICLLCKISDAIAFDDDEELNINLTNCQEWVESF